MPGTLRRKHIMPLKAVMFSNSKLRFDEEELVPRILEALKQNQLGESVGSMIQNMMTFDHSGEASGCRKVIAATSVSKRKEYRYFDIQGSDDSYFDRVDQTARAGPANVASFVVELIDGSGGIPGWVVKIIQDAEGYASSAISSKILEKQPHRMSLRFLIVSKQGEVCQVHFDRAGAAYTKPLSIRSDLETFVRLVLNSASRDVCILGFDPCVKFEKANGKRVSGTMKVKHELEGQARYELEVKPMYIEANRGLIARATTCFKLKKDEHEYVLKSTWRMLEDHSKEFSKLEMAKGIQGVVQVAAGDEFSVTTDMLRGLSETKSAKSGESSQVGSAHRVLILMECTGPPIYRFDTRKQFVEALYDAIRGLRGLWEAGLMHGDISINNVVLGIPGAPSGERGKLIDLDLALPVKPEVHHCQGTERYLSHASMQRGMRQLGDIRLKLPHSPMDDLESLFYVFLDVVVGMDGPSSSLPRLADQFFPQSFQDACDAKLSLFREKLEFDLASIPLYWGETTKELFQNFFKLIRELVVDKDSISRSGSREAFLALEDRVPQYFDELQEHFQDAINKLNEPTPLVAPSPGLAPSRCLWVRSKLRLQPMANGKTGVLESL
ncbi:hypothetical protein NMY22_g19295 [Coprinellus aureogranulatus]|nr:hypothetical protein NMY22_g19295 [Coprinellus aureogranulatus]